MFWEVNDGSKVWLNAVSSLRFPTSFTGPERSVELTGEAYFEVASDAAHPFVVEAPHAEVKVLGTKFDISSYDDDPGQKVTLQQGGVYVHETGALAGRGISLKPGYQVVIDGSARELHMNKANLEAVLGYFREEAALSHTIVPSESLT